MKTGDFRVVRNWKQLQHDCGDIYDALERGGEAAAQAARTVFSKYGWLEAGHAQGTHVESGPSWLLVYGRDEDDAVMVATIPLIELSDALRAALEAENGRSIAVVFGETSYDAPTHWDIWAEFAIGTGVRTVEEFVADLDTRAEAPDAPGQAVLAGWAGKWRNHVALSTTGEADPARLAAPVVGYTLIHEMM